MIAILLGVLGGGASFVVMAALGDMVSEEVRDRLDHLPHMILRLAALRLDPALRDDVYNDEWMPELTYILRGDEARPITRLYHGTRFALGILAAARRIANGLACSPELALEAQLVLAEGLSEVTAARDTCVLIDERLGIVEAVLANDTLISEAALASGTAISDAERTQFGEFVHDLRFRTNDILSDITHVIKGLQDTSEKLKEPGQRVSSGDIEDLRRACEGLRRAKALISQQVRESLTLTLKRPIDDS